MQIKKDKRNTIFLDEEVQKYITNLVANKELPNDKQSLSNNKQTLDSKQEDFNSLKEQYERTIEAQLAHIKSLEEQITKKDEQLERADKKLENQQVLTLGLQEQLKTYQLTASEEHGNKKGWWNKWKKITVKEVMELLQVSRQTVYRFIESKLLTSYKDTVSNRVYFDKEQVLAFKNRDLKVVNK